jgi:hypothetical protein
MNKGSCAPMATPDDLKPGCMVMLTKAPANLLRGLPADGNKAIRAIINHRQTGSIFWI